jgi:hypothetical protein
VTAPECGLCGLPSSVCDGGDACEGRVSPPTLDDRLAACAERGLGHRRAARVLGISERQARRDYARLRLTGRAGPPASDTPRSGRLVIPLTDDEQAELLERAEGERLATWARRVLLGERKNGQEAT